MSIIQFKPKQEVRKILDQEPKYKPYERAIQRFIDTHAGLMEWSRDDIKKLIYLEVKYIEAVNRTSKDNTQISFYKKTPMERFNLLDAVVNLIGLLKPVELVEMFPVTKYYDGEAIQMKDYYFTMAAINKLDQDKPIGKEAFALLWDYQNRTLTYFMLETMSAMNLAGMYQGKQDMTDFIFNTLIDKDEKKDTSQKERFTVIK